MYLFRDNWNMGDVLVVVMSTFIDVWYDKNESIIGITTIVLANISISSINLFEYRNFSFDATLVM